MSEFNRVLVTWGADLDVPADAVFDAAADWLNLIDYLHPDHPFKFTHCSAPPESDLNALPLERRLWPDKSSLSPEDAAATPDYFAETLYRADREARTLLYAVADGPLGMRNYWAWKVIDSLGPDRCRATMNTRFDLPASVRPEDIIPLIEQVYEGVIRGIERKLLIENAPA